MMHIHIVEGFLLGLIATSSFVACLFFLRFWRDTHDSLFLNFAIAFGIEGVNRTVMMLYTLPNEASPWVYLVRSFAFLLIVAAIVNKNRRAEA